MKLLQVNTVINSGSTGRIAEGIGEVVIRNGWESYIAFGRDPRGSKSKLVQLCKNWERYPNALYMRIFDKDGAFSSFGTKRLISAIEEINPDIIHLHNIHGYYLHVPRLFDYLVKHNKLIVWTLHDCWIMTGHCCHFQDCKKWQTHCFSCPRKKSYPASYIFDNSIQNHSIKIEFANKARDLLHFVPVSNWMNEQLKKSCFKYCESTTIRNGIDLNVFKVCKNVDEVKAKYSIEDGRYAICVSNIWNTSKGYGDLPKLAKLLKNENIGLVVVGVSPRQAIELRSNGIIPILRTESTEELAMLYSVADVFLNPTRAEALGLVNMEAIACGTPVITYESGGSPESVDEYTGSVVPVGDIGAMVAEAVKIIKNGKLKYKDACIRKAQSLFSKDDAFLKYMNLYEKLLGKL